MRAVIQLVKEASVKVSDEIVSKIDDGYLVLLGISIDDKEDDLNYIIDKVLNLRIIKDENDKMNNNISQINGKLLIVSQFTLYGDARKGRRPSYSYALNGNEAEHIYNNFIEKIKTSYKADNVFTGVFGAMMDVSLVNNGPVTILLDSQKKF